MSCLKGRLIKLVDVRANTILLLISDPSKINDLLPFIESIVWGSKNLNLDCIKELETFLYQSFGPEIFELLSKGANVQAEVTIAYQGLI